MKFKCVNENCTDFQKEKEFFKTVHKFLNGKFCCVESFCSKCGTEMQDISNEIPLSEKNIEFGKIASMSKDQRVKKLKDRSHAHYEKEIKDHRHDLLNKAMNEFKNM